MTRKAIHRILWTWRRVTEMLDIHCTVHWTYTGLCTGHRWSIYFTMHWMYTRFMRYTLYMDCVLIIQWHVQCYTLERTVHCTLDCILCTGVTLGCPTVFCTLYIDLGKEPTLGCTLDCALGLYTRCVLDCTPDVPTCVPDIMNCIPDCPDCT